MSILEDARTLVKSRPVCDACPGWAFVERNFGLTDAKWDKSLRVTATLDDDEPREVVGAEDCWVCEGACVEFGG